MESGRLLNEREHANHLSQKPILVGCTAGAFIFLVIVAYLSYVDVQPAPQFAVAVASSDDYTEVATSVVYPAKTKVPVDNSGDYRVLGAGARIKAIGPIGVKVYAVALYVEAKGARSALKAFQGKSPSVVTNDQSFFDILEKGAFNKMVELRMKRGVDRDTMVDAICEALEPRMKARDPQRADVLVQQFKGLFTDKSFKTGDSLRIFQVGKSLYVSVNGDKRAPVNNEPKLCEAFFAIYTDDKSPAPDARKHFADRLQNLW